MAELSPTDRTGNYRLGFAGDTFNTAWYLRRILGDAQVAYFTVVGADALSDQLLAFISCAGIDTSGIRRIDGSTVGLYLISLKDGERSFSYWRDTSAARRLSDDPAALGEAMANADQVFFSGITLAILDAPGRARLLGALRDARAKGRTIVFDPNLRPRLWASAEEMTASTMAGAEVSDIVLPSFEDEASFFNDRDATATANRYARAGAETVVVKNGGDAVSYRNGQEGGTVDMPIVRNVVDTTAAGDSFNAGFLAAYHTGKPMRESISDAANIAGQAIRGKGALVPIETEAATS